MWKFILRRILGMIPQLFVLSILVFMMAKAMPGDALTGRQMDPKADPERIAEQRVQMGLNDPVHVQYIRWIKNIAHGDWGVSYTHKTRVTEVIGDRIWNTVYLAFGTLLITYLLAIPLGIISGRWNDSWMDKAITGYNYLGYATPVFIFALLMLFLFSFTFALFPAGGSVDPYIEPGTFSYVLNKINHLVLPVMSGALVATVTTVQYLKNEIIDTKTRDFIRTARSKGIPDSKVYSGHILRNAFLPIAAFLGYEITGLVGGSVFIESIYSYPGIGQLFVTSVMLRDFSVVTALVMMTSFATLLGTLLSDIILSAVDPRIRIE
ncbi:ABC transporter permease [Peribacillus cavernae]|uniref:ABC transporter permease n=1 Tax=Peribacillus cavernae TaxID=1674310 RepID=A0A3S0VLF0_9BACI|nr:oligopeptide ABC transporter permease [Peribacillus cavernae]MDQ0217343.1 peptide/nickel transport system permease protein [Peribacillus cavernae]RUQ30204.1 ABC transporter permease [Peribacillus cavernae]